MSKKLCEDARLAAECLKETNTFPTGQSILLECADRIEQLEKELSISRMASVVMDNTVSELEAKLAKAVEALRDMCAEFRGHDLPYGSKAYLKAMTTLAELDGMK